MIIMEGVNVIASQQNHEVTVPAYLKTTALFSFSLSLSHFSP